ncbi:sulfite exporter TauE/SafE family protein [Polynucleobacter sp. JS-Fieb-80-E5]|uniref:sulfite exporter TauE/SafE family protein n=1 Tax=Polynucleobacter sp. JS-Fieb-80-E5 TaxID=2081050 RepID=UPI001C0DD4C4|nr:sulfite exporter TauE/SafE family protein [Polynucleobacter sp. JS-Fieb-80-E5]MBU3617994.1 sulfite exporter TauE/SafE family protein [Polynucleobacter sp. JS-Fieb-80-E5]
MLDLLFTPLVQSFHAHSLAFFVCAVISVTILGISKSGFGAGLGTLSLPLMASQAPINEALAIMLPLLIVIDLVGLRRYIQNANWGILKIVIPPAIAGLLLGMIFFTAITPQVLTLSIGIFTLLFLIQNLAMSRIEAKETKSYPWLGRAMGLTSGFTSFVAHIGGPPITVYMLREKLLPMVYTSTLGVFFTVMNFGKLGPYAYLDLLNYKQLATSIILLPCAPVGVYFGFYLAKRISMKWYYRTVRFFLLIASIKLISDGLI